MECLLFSLKIGNSCLYIVRSNSFVSPCLNLSLIHAVSMPSYRLCLIRVSRPSLEILSCVIYTSLFLELFSKSLTGRIKSSCPLLTSNLIANVGFARDILPAILLLFKVILSLPVLVRHIGSFRYVTTCFLTCPLSYSISLFVPLPRFLSGHLVCLVVDGHSSIPKLINTGLPQGSFLTPAILLLFINDLPTIKCPNHSYTDDSSLHY